MNIRHLILAGVVIFSAATAGQAVAEEYAIDKAHSSVAFTTTHLMVSKVSGHFADYDGVVDFEPANLGASKVNVTVQAASIDTNNEKRDEHLKTGDFFDVAQYPSITFVSKKIVKNGDKYDITGDLTIKGVTKEVTFPAEIAGPVNSPMGGTAIGITAWGKINRQDFGVKWNKNLDNGGVMVSDDVDINVSIEAHKK